MSARRNESRKRQTFTVLGLAVLLTGCVSDEEIFTSGRLENQCSAAIPICRVRASCQLGNTDYVRRSFPGGFQAIVENDNLDEGRAVVRVMLTEMIAPGTEYHVILHSPGCGSIDEERVADVDVFAYAGRDRVIEMHLSLEGRGDHLLEVFSDMNADYLLTVTLEEND